MNKSLIILTLCSILSACAGAPNVAERGDPLIDFATIARQIEVRYEPLDEVDKPVDAVLAAADGSR